MNLTVSLLNLADCLERLGEIGSARATAAEALATAVAADRRDLTRNSRALLGWVAGLAGDTCEAEQQFIAADQMQVADSDGHLYSLGGTLWAAWLARTGRSRAARELNTLNALISRDHGWHEDAARCERVLGLIALAAGDTAEAGSHLEAAAGVFRDGDYLTELADTVADLAGYSLAAGDLNAADRHATEAITIAAPRGMVPAHAGALAARARIRAARATATGDLGLISQGRDAADAALRLATRHVLAWHELAALRAHADLDQAEHASHGWAAQADALHARLVPPGLDADPLATVEGLVAAANDNDGES
jgi:tetratricopeptide (TPR) repeat protein